MKEDLYYGSDDKNIVVIAPVGGTISIKASAKNNLDKEDGKVVGALKSYKVKEIEKFLR